MVQAGKHSVVDVRVFAAGLQVWRAIRRRYSSGLLPLCLLGGQPHTDAHTEDANTDECQTPPRPFRNDSFDHRVTKNTSMHREPMKRYPSNFMDHKLCGTHEDAQWEEVGQVPGCSGCLSTISLSSVSRDGSNPIYGQFGWSGCPGTTLRSERTRSTNALPSQASCIVRAFSPSMTSVLP